MTTISVSQQAKKGISDVSVFAIVFLFFASVLLLFKTKEWGMATDWVVFYSAGKSMLSPYIGYFINPPWMAAILSPFTEFGFEASHSLWMAFSLTIVVFFLYKNKVHPISIFLVLTSPFSFIYMYSGQIDTIVLIGYMMLEANTRFSILFLTIKPQVIIFSVIGRLNKESLVIFVVDGLIILSLSFVIWGMWIDDMYTALTNDLITTANISLFPYLIPVGIYLLYLSYKKQDTIYGAFATPCFTPYILPHSIFVLYALFVTRTKIKYQIIVYALSWVWFLKTKGLL